MADVEQLTCTRTQLREIFGGIGNTRLTQFLAEGMPKPVAKGIYDVVACVKWYLERRHRQDHGIKRRTHSDYYNEVAHLKHLERRKLEGSLVELVAVRELMAAIGTAFADFADGFPTLVSEEIANLDDPTKIERLLDAELDQGRNAVADAIEAFEFESGVRLEPQTPRESAYSDMDGEQSTSSDGGAEGRAVA